MTKDKLGPYINRLMTTILDSEQEEFVKDLAWNELKRLNTDVESFLRKNAEEVKETQKQEKQLLQEDKKNVTNK